MDLYAIQHKLLLGCRVAEKMVFEYWHTAGHQQCLALHQRWFARIRPSSIVLLCHRMVLSMRPNLWRSIRERKEPHRISATLLVYCWHHKDLSLLVPGIFDRRKTHSCIGILKILMKWNLVETLQFITSSTGCRTRGELIERPGIRFTLRGMRDRFRCTVFVFYTNVDILV